MTADGGIREQRRTRMTRWALRRRGWLVPLVAALTTAVAYAVSTVVPQHYSAESVLVVPAKSAERSIGSVDQASRLAATYARLIPSDPRVLRRVGRAVDLPVDSVASRAGATTNRSVPLLRLRFRGPTPASAIKGVTAMASAVAGGTPVTSAITPNSLELARVARSVRKSDSTRRPGFIAEAVLVASADATQGTNGDASQAVGLAKTYALLIPADRRVIREVARAAGTTASSAEGRLSVSTDFDTSLIRLRFEADTAAAALAGARAGAKAVAGPAPATPRITPRSIEAVNVATKADRNLDLSRNAIPIGLVLGLGLGVVLLVAFERADARVDDARSLGEVAICPASSLKDMSDVAVLGLLEHWRDLAHHEPARIGLLPAATSSVGSANDAASRLGRVAHVEGDQQSQWQIDAGDVPGGAQAGERLAASSDLVVLVAARGTKVAQVRQAVRLLEQFGEPPRWALLTPRRRRWARRRDNGRGDGPNGDRVLSAVRPGRGGRADG